MKLKDCYNFNDFRKLAKKKLPSPIFHYIDGAADDEITYKRNTSSFNDVDLVPNVLRGVENVDLSTTIFGKKLDLPFYLAPTALQRLFHYDGERAVGKAAQKFNTMFGVSALATVSVEEISSLNIPLAGKTGTTNDNKDAWFIGFSPDLALGVFVGFDKPKTLGYKQTGSAVAVPIFKKFMKKANINKNKIPFRIPSGLSFVKIDQNTGLMTKDSDGILEPFIVGTEPYNNNIIKLDNLSSINNNSISGTGSLLIQ